MRNARTPARRTADDAALRGRLLAALRYGAIVLTAGIGIGVATAAALVTAVELLQR